ncbi:MAG TPA: D-2-hydroxyacid dehydrogenase family protein [Thermopolyspora sp.]
MSPDDKSFRVAILDDYQGVAREYGDWAALAPRVEVTEFREHIGDADELARRLAGFDAVVAMRERTALPGDLLRRLPGLRLILTTGMANASIDLAAADELGVTVCGTAGRTGSAGTVELTWALILACARRVPVQDASIRAGGWQATTPGSIGTTLSGKTLGIVGLGNIGAALVPVARAFGMRVTGWSRNLTAERAAQVGVTPLPREEFFATADFVTVHIKGGPRAHHYVNADDLRHMGPSSYLVNTSRGPVVDQDALARAVREGAIAGAALDVYDEEPLPKDHPLRDLPGIVLTPHIGYVTQETYREYFPQLVEGVTAFLAGDPVRVLGGVGR